MLLFHFHYQSDLIITQCLQEEKGHKQGINCVSQGIAKWNEKVHEEL